MFIGNVVFCRGLDESHFRKLFLKQNVVMLRKRDIERSKQPEPATVTVEEVRDYNYNNENDASYCPNNLPVSNEKSGLTVILALSMVAVRVSYCLIT